MTCIVGYKHVSVLSYVVLYKGTLRIITAKILFCAARHFSDPVHKL